MEAVNQPGALVLTLAPGQTLRLTIEILGGDEATRHDAPRHDTTRAPEQRQLTEPVMACETAEAAPRSLAARQEERHEQLNREIRALAGALRLDARALFERICREFEVDDGLASLDLASKETLLSRLTDERDARRETPPQQRLAATAEQQRAIARLSELRGLTADQAAHHWYNSTAAQLSEVEAAELIVRLQEKVRPLRRQPKGGRAA